MTETFFVRNERNNPPHTLTSNICKMFYFLGYQAQPQYPPVNNDRDGQSQDIDGKQSTKSSNHLKYIGRAETTQKRQKRLKKTNPD